MTKALIILLALFTLTACNNKEIKVDKAKQTFELVDKKLTENNIVFSRNVELTASDYYAKEAWQYVINDAACIVDIYYYGEESDIYKDALEKGAVKSKIYDNQYIYATINKGIAAIIWDSCNIKSDVETIIMGLE